MINIPITLGFAFISGLICFAIGFYEGYDRVFSENTDRLNHTRKNLYNALVECRRFEEKIEDCPRCGRNYEEGNKDHE